MGTCYLDHPKRLPPGDPVIGSEIKGHLYYLKGCCSSRETLPASYQSYTFLKKLYQHVPRDPTRSPESQCRAASPHHSVASPPRLSCLQFFESTDL